MTVEFRGVSHRYGKVLALRDFNYRFEPGITALLGVNGAGKSTMLNLAAGIVAPTQGGVLVADLDLNQRASRKEALGKVNLMPQGPTFPSRMTAHDIVTYLAWLKGLSGGDAQRRATESLEKVGLADRARTRYGAWPGESPSLRRSPPTRTCCCSMSRTRE